MGLGLHPIRDAMWTPGEAPFSAWDLITPSTFTPTATLDL